MTKNKRKMINESQFRENIRLIRATRGHTAEKLSEICKLKSKKRINDIEEGRVSAKLDEAIRICDALGVGLNEMVTQKAIVTITFKGAKRREVTSITKTPLSNG